MMLERMASFEAVRRNREAIEREQRDGGYYRTLIAEVSALPGGRRQVSQNREGAQPTSITRDNSSGRIYEIEPKLV